MVALIVGLSLGCAMLAGLISFGIYMKCRKSSKVQVETMDTTMSEEQKIGSVKGSSEHNRTLGINDKINERNVSSEFNTSKIET